MARIQILELPTIAGLSGATVPPYIIVIDEVSAEWADRTREDLGRLKEATGARAVLSFEGETVDIPANNTSAPDVTTRIGDTEYDTHIREIVREEIGGSTPVGEAVDETQPPSEFNR